MNISMKQKQIKDTENRLMVAKAWGRGDIGEEWIGRCKRLYTLYIMQTIIHIMDKQGLTVLHREQLYSISVINHNGKENEKRISKYVKLSHYAVDLKPI